MPDDDDVHPGDYNVGAMTELCRYYRPQRVKKKAPIGFAHPSKRVNPDGVRGSKGGFSKKSRSRKRP